MPLYSDDLFVTPNASLYDCVACIDRNGAKGIVLVVDDSKRLLGTVTDGDIRRAILAGISMNTLVRKLLPRKANSPYPVPITAAVDTEHEVLLKMMQKRSIRQIPLLEKERVVGLVTLDELLPQKAMPIQAVVMAGGFGTRLQPLTEDLPKPMLPIGNRPLLEHTIGHLRNAGIRQVNITTHYLSEQIKSHFGDGREFGVELNYVSEDFPLGTAGGLSLMETPKEPVLVINGDIMTEVDFRAMLAFHREQSAELTVGVRQYDLQVPYGVIETDGIHIKNVEEKPVYTFFVNAGIYMLEPGVIRCIPIGKPFDMTDLIERLVTGNRSVVSFPIIEYWLDIGQPEDYKRAQEKINNVKEKK